LLLFATNDSFKKEKNSMSLILMQSFLKEVRTKEISEK